MLDLDSIEVSEAWDVMKENCTITAEGKITGQIVLSLNDINTREYDVVAVAKGHCALRVFDALYGDLRTDVAEMIGMLKRAHPDRAAVDEIEHRMITKLGHLNG